MVRGLPHKNTMKIPSDNLGPSLLKPLDAETAGAALDAARLGQQPSHAAESLRADPVQQTNTVAPTRDRGESMLATDVWNGAAEGARRLTLSSTAVLQADNSAALDQLAESILSGLA